VRGGDNRRPWRHTKTTTKMPSSLQITAPSLSLASSS
jgi:hypothetical protein